MHTAGVITTAAQMTKLSFEEVRDVPSVTEGWGGQGPLDAKAAFSLSLTSGGGQRSLRVKLGPFPCLPELCGAVIFVLPRFLSSLPLFFSLIRKYLSM